MYFAESDYDRQKVNEVLKQHDEELETFIAGNINSNK